MDFYISPRTLITPRRSIIHSPHIPNFGIPSEAGCKIYARRKRESLATVAVSNTEHEVLKPSGGEGKLLNMILHKEHDFFPIGYV